LQQEKSAIINARAVAGLGITVSSRLSVGAALGANYNQNSPNAPYIFQNQPVLADLKTLLNIHTEGAGWNAGTGALFRATRKDHIGAAWKSRTMIDSTGQSP
jgi:hypothetical protein